MFFFDEEAEHLFDAAAEKVLLGFVHGLTGVFGTGDACHVAMGLALAFDFEEIDIALLAQHLQVGGNGGVGGTRFGQPLQNVPGTGGLIDVPQGTHHFKLHFRQRIFLSSHNDRYVYLAAKERPPHGFRKIPISENADNGAFLTFIRRNRAGIKKSD